MKLRFYYVAWPQAPSYAPVKYINKGSYVYINSYRPRPPNPRNISNPLDYCITNLRDDHVTEAMDNDYY